MSGQQQHPQIDPRLRLGGDSTPSAPPPPLKYERPPPVPQTYAPSPPQPYYHYPTPQGHTPQQPTTGAPSTGSASNQASPAAPPPPGAYHIPHDANANNSHDDGEGGIGEDPKRPRACEACRGLKVRCDQDPAHPELPCRRCQKAGRQCIITAPSRKRQKKADSRVTELEKKLDALTAVLQQQQQTGHVPQPQQQYAPSPRAGPAPPADMMQGRQQPANIQQALQQYHQNAADSPSARSGSSGMQPPQKRRRTEEGATDTQESADNANAGRMGRYQANQPVQDDSMKRLQQMSDSWGPYADSMRYLIHRSPEEFMNRINTLVNPEIGVTIFNRYLHKLAPQMPAVVFHPDTTAEQILKEKPILYVCILSASSAGTLHPDVTKQLSREAIRAIADCVVCNGAKSLELIQAMQVLALWYKPPEKAEQTNFYQIIHMAAVMAIDIGLGKRFNATKARRGFGGPHAEFAPGPQMQLPQNSDTIEARRAWLSCYFLCACASMVLRRPNLVRWSHYMKECVDILGSSPEALPSDKLFCQHIKIQHICEEIGLQFLMDDNTATISITDPKVTYQLNVLENELKTWSDNIPAELKQHPGLCFFEHVANLYLHEIALHFNHNIEDFRLPFTEESLKAVNNSSETLTQHQMAALDACRKAANGILDTMLSYNLDTVKALPMLIFFVRCTYALVILIKMHVAITTPGSEISKIMAPEDVRVDHYIDSLMGMFGSVANQQEFRPHPKILRILTVLKDWFGKHKENIAAQARGEPLPHPPTWNGQDLMQQADRLGQTPLHMLSQVATANRQSDQQPQQGEDQGRGEGWTFNTPFPVDYSQRPAPGHPDSRFPVHQEKQAQQQQATYPPPPDNGQAYAAGGPDQYGIDGTIPDYLWGSGFEQAMGINLGSMDELNGSGMDGLFLGGGMGPFNFNGDPGAASGW
ncbi:Transcription factor pbcR [Fulvia fulva]|nr:Transcription factor pbcR [Fulvia fulva]